MSKLIPIKGFKRLAASFAIVVALTSCSTTNQQSSTPMDSIVLGQVEHSAAHYLALSQQASGVNKLNYQLQAVRAYLVDAQYTSAQELLLAIDPMSLTLDYQQVEYQLLRSSLLAQQGNTADAITTLKPSTTWQLSPQRWRDFYQQKMSFQLNDNQVIDAAISLIAMAPHIIDPVSTVKNQQTIWQLLSQAPSDILTEVMSEVLHFDGWKALVLTTQQSLLSPIKLQQALAQWRFDYPRHPAVNNLPSALVNAVDVIPFTPQKVALLLPLSGRYARLGTAIQNGIIGNLTNRESAPELLIFDTEKLGADGAYSQALAGGAEFIIGPLLKKNVEFVNQQATNIPILLLNKAPTTQLSKLHYYFSLDKESEAIQGSEYIFKSGKKFPAIIAPDNSSGRRISALFIERWQQLTNNPTAAVAQFFFDDNKALKLTVEKLFETNESQQRINKTRALAGSKMKAEIRSRRDIDAVYLVSNPLQTSMLKPSIDVTVSAFAPKMSIYVGSTGNKSHNQSRSTNDLNQLYVSEQPWLLQLRDTKLSSSKVKRLWPKLSHSQQHFFAMGYDAFELIGYLAQMGSFPQLSLDGFSGDLSLDSAQQTIHRKISWAQYQRGQLVVQE